MNTLNNPFLFPAAAKEILLRYFFGVLSDHLSVFGCNDMPKDIFRSLSDQDRAELYAGFLRYDEIANPDGWEPPSFDSISDSSWFGYLRKRLSV